MRNFLFSVLMNS